MAVAFLICIAASAAAEWPDPSGAICRIAITRDGADVRETPDGEPKSTMLTYEATEGDRRLEVFMENDKVVRISMY